MKKILCFILSIIIVLSCNNVTHENGELKELNQKGIISKEEAIKADKLKKSYPDAYLTELSIKRIGELILIDSIIPIDNDVTFKLLDTISSCNEKDLNFFLSVFNKIMFDADGALSEAVGVYTLKFIKMRPKIFISLIDTLSNESINEWAQYTAYELYFNHEEDSLVNYCNSLVNNLKDLSVSDNLLQFEKQIILNAKTIVED